MKYQTLKLFMLLCLGFVLLTGCGKQSDQVTLNIYNWGDYIAPEIIDQFTEETGIKVNYETFDSNEAMYAKVKSGAVDYDVLFPSDYMIQKMTNEKMLLSLNFDAIPNFSLIDPQFKNLAYDAQGLYSVPYMWGTVGILYNTTMVSEPVDSWQILWNEKYKNQIIMQKSVRDTFGVALKKLGYSLNSSDEAELEAAKQALLEQKPLVSAYVIDEVRDKMIGDEAALAVIYSGEALVTEAANPNLAYAIPKEGSNLWTDAMVIPNTSKHQAQAELFINYMCRTDVALANTNYIGYSTPQIDVKSQLTPDVLNNVAAYPSDDILSTCEVYLDLGSEVNDIYNNKWNELMAY